ncbi:uncharacterized protein LOC116344180 [Contarinia nasturtii]|uniref:uncharacterized protein LOC116344180 n=1 Tax=Contarinia nasturtii TaxID=265458 RepID=UPI0012D44AEB|nr:uncharacterized protein LOC116344180 [Contarinia nasturtii]
MAALRSVLATVLIFCIIEYCESNAGFAGLRISNFAFEGHKLANGGNCDGTNPFKQMSKYCEPYVKIFVNGQQVFRSETKSAAVNAVKFSEHYENAKIPRDAKIRIEVWDSDSGNAGGSKDDLILRKEVTLNQCLGYQTIDNGHGSKLSFNGLLK